MEKKKNGAKIFFKKKLKKLLTIVLNFHQNARHKSIMLVANIDSLHRNVAIKLKFH